MKKLPINKCATFEAPYTVLPVLLNFIFLVGIISYNAGKSRV